MPRTKCRLCGALSYGFPLCSRCRKKANDGREVEGRVARWDKLAKVFKLEVK